MTQSATALLIDSPMPHRANQEALGPAGRLVWDFLTLFAEQRHADANAYLAPGCQMVFPGDVVMTDCREVPKNAASVYRWVKKVFEEIDELEGDGQTVVYILGTLQGEWLDGTPLRDVRYIDRFVVRDGKIVDQRVWNDVCIADRRRQG